jgi:hypothetical protein
METFKLDAVKKVVFEVQMGEGKVETHDPFAKLRLLQSHNLGANATMSEQADVVRDVFDFCVCDADPVFTPSNDAPRICATCGKWAVSDYHCLMLTKALYEQVQEIVEGKKDSPVPQS